MWGMLEQMSCKYKTQFSQPTASHTKRLLYFCSDFGECLCK